MTDQEEFEFDVAFSFLKEDEIIAYNVNDLIQDRIKTFIYSKNQEGLVGFDGEERFHEIFGKKSRLVVIFYKQNWGLTPWTRIEMTAIKNRSLDNGYGFTIFVPLDKSPVPIWLPRTIIWFNYERWGASGLAGVIESKLSESGIEIKKVETASDFAARKKRELDLKKEIGLYLRSQDAYSDANTEFNTILDEVNRVAKTLHDLGLSNGLAGNSRREITIKAGWYSLVFNWSVAYSNSLTDSSLLIAITKRTNDWDERPYTIVKKVEYVYHMNEIKRKGWKTKMNNEFYQSLDLVDKWIKDLLKLIER